jgi:hypothetical protein
MQSNHLYHHERLYGFYSEIQQYHVRNITAKKHRIKYYIYETMNGDKVNVTQVYTKQEMHLAPHKALFVDSEYMGIVTRCIGCVHW